MVAMPKRASKRKPKIQLSPTQEQAATITDGLPSDPTIPSLPTSNNPAAVALGRLGGKKGGLARAAKLSKKRRSEIAKKAAAARWKKS